MPKRSLAYCFGWEGMCKLSHQVREELPKSSFIVDFHVHIGFADGKPVKISAGKTMTLEAVLEGAIQKGIDLVGITDGVTGPVRTVWEKLIARGDLALLAGGGYRYRDAVTIVPGAEVELRGPHGGAAHFGLFVGNLDAAASLYEELAHDQTNPDLSSQRLNVNFETMADWLDERNGIVIINHAFTPHKGLYGSCVTHASEMIDLSRAAALELGLSADTDMADRVSELRATTFVTNSDAHSTPKLAREYHVARMDFPDFENYKRVLRRDGSFQITENVGMWPTLGKYHRSFCLACGAIATIDQAVCSSCGNKKFTRGVYERLHEVADQEISSSPDYRPPYRHHIPLDMIPGIGKKTRDRLLSCFAQELSVMRMATIEELTDCVGPLLANRIDLARHGRLGMGVGAGGVYGKVLAE